MNEPVMPFGGDFVFVQAATMKRNKRKFTDKPAMSSLPRPLPFCLFYSLSLTTHRPDMHALALYS